GSWFVDASALREQGSDQGQAVSTTEPTSADGTKGGKRSAEADAATAVALPVGDKLDCIARCSVQRRHSSQFRIRVGARIEQKERERVLAAQRRVRQGVDAIRTRFVDRQTSRKQQLRSTDIACACSKSERRKPMGGDGLNVRV